MTIFAVYFAFRATKGSQRIYMLWKDRNWGQDSAMAKSLPWDWVMSEPLPGLVMCFCQTRLFVGLFVVFYKENRLFNIYQTVGFFHIIKRLLNTTDFGIFWANLRVSRTHTQT